MRLLFDVQELGHPGAAVAHGPERTYLVIDTEVDPEDWTRHALEVLSITEAIEFLKRFCVAA